LTLEKQNGELSKQTVTIATAVEGINTLLHDSGFQGFELRVQSGSGQNSYRVIRPHNGKVAKDLSEGERNFLAFLYFYHLVRGSHHDNVMGDAYEFLIKKFADLSKKNAGEFYTPRAIVKLLVMLLAPKAGETVYDPAAGTGGMLIEAIRYMHDDKQTYGRIYGHDVEQEWFDEISKNETPESV
jgi:hypothetical protein